MGIQSEQTHTDFEREDDGDLNLLQLSQSEKSANPLVAQFQNKLLKHLNHLITLKREPLFRPQINQLNYILRQTCQMRIDLVKYWKEGQIATEEAQMLLDHLYTVFLHTSKHKYKGTTQANQNFRWLFGHKTIQEWQ